MTDLALLGGPKAVTRDAGDIFQWPVVTREDEEAVLDVLRRGAMSGTDVTVESEAEFAAWLGTKFALAYPSGTESIRAALWACGGAAGDEVISSSMVIWAGCSQALALGAAVHFADMLDRAAVRDPVVLLAERQRPVGAVELADDHQVLFVVAPLGRNGCGDPG